jgi:hypothetical protein
MAEDSSGKDQDEPEKGAEDKRRQNQKKPNFWVECILTGELRFRPTGDQFRDSQKSCLEKALRQISGMRNFLQVEDFNEFTNPLAELGDVAQLEEQQSDLYGLVTQDPIFRDTQRKIGERYDNLFDRVQVFAERFQPLVEVYRENQIMIECDDCEVSFKDSSLDDFRDALAKYKQQRDDIELMPRSTDIGLFRLDTAKLQETLEPSPRLCKDLLDKYIPALVPFFSRSSRSLRPQCSQRPRPSGAMRSWP